MGFFSSECEGCGHPALSIYATNDINRWMMRVVAIREDGFRAAGEYDGYGGLETEEGTWEHAVGFGTTVWHESCWIVAGRPTDYRGETNAPDQGYFFDEGDHDMADPLGLDIG